VRRGTSFESAFATPLCCPSRVSFLRGQYAHNHGVLDNKNSPRQPGGYEGCRELGLQDSTAATWAGRLKSLKSVGALRTHSPPFAHPSAPASGRRVPISGPPRILLGPFPRIVLSSMDPRAGKNHPHFPHTSPILSAQETHPYDRPAFRSAERIG
jgi:hypothetical protein